MFFDASCRLDAGLAPARLDAGSHGRALPGTSSCLNFAPHGCGGCRIAGATGPGVKAADVRRGTENRRTSTSKLRLGSLLRIIVVLRMVCQLQCLNK